jgi:uncharacterized integral membrane protein
MPLFLIFALVIAVLAVIFALQNAMPIAVSFFAWRYEGSLALVLLLTLGLGVIISLLVSVPTMIRKRIIISSQKKTIEDLEKSLEEKSETPNTPIED